MEFSRFINAHFRQKRRDTAVPYNTIAHFISFYCILKKNRSGVFDRSYLYYLVYATICRYIDEEVVGSGMGLFLIGGHLPKILPQHSKGAS
jgi:hypothetical protein